MRYALMAAVLFLVSSVSEGGIIFHRGYVTKSVVKVGPNGVKAVCRTGTCRVR